MRGFPSHKSATEWAIELGLGPECVLIGMISVQDCGLADSFRSREASRPARDEIAQEGPICS